MKTSIQHPLGVSTLVALVGLVPSLSYAQTTFSWAADTGGAWSDAANWSPEAGGPPGTTATDIVQFNKQATSPTITLADPTTIGNLQFLAGSGAYTFSGAALTIGGSSNTKITNSSGQHQIFSNTVVLHSDTTKGISVTNGGSLTFSNLQFSGQGARRNLSLSGDGTITINGFTSTGNDRVNQAVVDAATTLNWNASNTFVVQDFRVSGQLNLFRGIGDSGLSVRLLADGAQVYLSAHNMTLSSANLEFSQGNGNTATFGANIAGGGTATRSANVKLNASASLTNATHRLYAAADNTLVITGVVTDTNASGAGTKVEIAGAGVVRFSGTSANTSVTPISIAEGATLELAKSTAGLDAIAGGHVTINTGGTLRLAESNQIADATDLTFAGGTFEVGEFTESLGALTVGEAGGVIDFGGSAGSLTFATLSSMTGTLTINGWSENATITFGDGSGWDSTALSRVVFSGYGAAQFNADTGELYASAIPEPASVAALFGTCALLSATIARRRVR